MLYIKELNIKTKTFLKIYLNNNYCVRGQRTKRRSHRHLPTKCHIFIRAIYITSLVNIRIPINNVIMSIHNSQIFIIS